MAREVANSKPWDFPKFGTLYAEPSRNGLMRPKSVRGTGVAMVNMGEIFAHDRIGDVPMELVPLSESEAERFLLKDGDLLFARASLVLAGAGKVSIMLPAAYPRTFESHIIRVRLDAQRVDPSFYYYFFKSPLGRTTMETIVEQVSAAGIRASDLATLPVPLPPLPEQRAIAGVLGALDDKIEVNRTTARVLEGIARAVFTSWFVDFDPVRSNIRRREHAALGRAGRFISTGDDITISDPSGKVIHRAGDAAQGPLAHLFPDRLVDSAIGEVPEGWRVGTLGDFFELGLGGAWGEDAADARADTAIRCLRGIDCHALAEGTMPDIPVRWVSAKQAADRVLRDGSILFEGSGSFCGRSLCWDDDYASLVSSPIGYSNFCKRIDPKSGTTGIDPSQALICWLAVRRAYRTGELQAFRTGTAFPNLDIHGVLANLPVVVPSGEPARRFADFFRTTRRLDLIPQSATLAALRDALLPKLISGELRIESAEKIVGRAVDG